MTDTQALVFVVDDDAVMRESLENLLRSVGLRGHCQVNAKHCTSVQ